jgi:hypothetical protein
MWQSNHDNPVTTKLPIAHKLARAPRLTAPLPRRYEAPQRPFHRMNMDRIAGQLRAAAAGHAFSVADRRQVDIPTTGAALQRARCAGIPRSGDPERNHRLRWLAAGNALQIRSAGERVESRAPNVSFG